MAETKFSFNEAAAAVNKIDNIGMVKVKDINDKNKENMLKLMLSPTAETKETTVVDESNSSLSATTSYLSSPHGSVLQSHSETMDAILCVDTDIVDNTSPQSQDSDAFLESTYASISSQNSTTSALSREDKLNLCNKAKGMASAAVATTTASTTKSADPFAISNQLKAMQENRQMNMENLCNQLETQRELLQAASKSIITDINNKEAKQKKETADKVEQISSLNKQVEETKAKNTEYKVLTKQLQTKNSDLAVELGNMLSSVQEVFESNTVLENQVEEANAQTTASEQKNAELVKKVEVLTIELNKAKKENQESVAKIAAAFKLADDAAASMGRLFKMANENKQQVVDADSKVSQLTQEVHDMLEE